MAAMERPKKLGECSCGEILIQYSGEEPHWTRSASIKALFTDNAGTATMDCPGHGGDPRIKVGGGYHPRFRLEVAV